METKEKNLLLLVDCQNDFIEGGSLPVEGAQIAMERLAEFIKERDGFYENKVLTIDWHPFNHCSFVENGGTWPLHCLQHSHGAAISPTILDAVNNTKGNVTFLTKGDTSSIEEYSIFKNLESNNDLYRLVKGKEITQIDICGIAGDICVLNTLKDGIKYFGKEMFRVLLPYCPSLDGGKALLEYTTTNNLNFIA